MVGDGPNRQSPPSPLPVLLQPSQPFAINPKDYPVVSMLSTREELKSALEAYCSHIAANNRRALETLIPIIANWVPNEEDYDEVTEDGGIPLFRLRSLCHLVGLWSVVGQLSDPTDLLTRWEELAPLLELDGVHRLRVPGEDAVLADQEYRELKFNEYVTVVEAALKDRVLEEARGTVAFPEELRILFELGVDGLSGAGLEIWQGQFGCAFWIGLGQEPVKDLAVRVQGPDTRLGRWGGTIRDCFSPFDGWEVEWIIAGGWGIGCGCDAQTCCAVFCRRPDEEEFAWRYTISCEYDGRVFDTIPQLFDYYKDFEQGAMDMHVEWNANEECLFPFGLF